MRGNNYIQNIWEKVCSLFVVSEKILKRRGQRESPLSFLIGVRGKGPLLWARRRGRRMAWKWRQKEKGSVGNEKGQGKQHKSSSSFVVKKDDKQ